MPNTVHGISEPEVRFSHIGPREVDSISGDSVNIGNMSPGYMHSGTLY